MSKGRQYKRIWTYITTKMTEDTALPYKVGDPCLVAIDIERKQLIIKTIAKEKAIKEGWRAKAAKAG